MHISKPIDSLYSSFLLHGFCADEMQNLAFILLSDDTCPARSPGEEVLQVLQSSPYSIEEMKEQEANLPPEDSKSQTAFCDPNNVYILFS